MKRRPVEERLADLKKKLAIKEAFVTRITATMIPIRAKILKLETKNVPGNA